MNLRISAHIFILIGASKWLNQSQMIHVGIMQYVHRKDELLDFHILSIFQNVLPLR